MANGKKAYGQCLERGTKREAYRRMAGFMAAYRKRQAHGGSMDLFRLAEGMEGLDPKIKFKCVLLMPSYDCYDVAEFANMFNRETKFICVENFEDADISRSQARYRENFLAKCMENGVDVDPDNVHCHFGDLETLQLGAVLKRLGADKVDFLFLDMCRTLKQKHFQWLWDNRDYIAAESEGGFQLYTVPLQPRGRTYDRHEEMLDQMPHVIGYDPDVRIVTISGDGRENRLRGNGKSHNVADYTLYWNFILSHALNTSIDKDAMERLHSLRPIVYMGGSLETMKMGLFGMVSLDAPRSEERWRYCMSWLEENYRKSDEFIQDNNGIEWGRPQHGNRRVRHTFNDGDIALFRDMPINRTRELRMDRMFKYLLRNKRDKSDRRFCRDRMLQVMHTVCSWNFPGEYKKLVHKSSSIDFDRCEQLYLALLDGRTFHCGIDNLDYRFEFDRGLHKPIMIRLIPATGSAPAREEVCDPVNCPRVLEDEE